MCDFGDLFDKDDMHDLGGSNDFGDMGCTGDIVDHGSKTWINGFMNEQTVGILKCLGQQRPLFRRKNRFSLRAISLLIILQTAISYSAFSQEFDCTVTINRDQISGNAYEYVTELKQNLETYINETKWTDLRFEETERIRCSIQIIFTSATPDFDYSAQFVASIQRPIYNTLQRTTTLLINDDVWTFQYPRGKSLIRDDLQFDALTTFIDFYMMVFLGYDADTFSPLGGSAYYSKAKLLQELAETSGGMGWGRAIGAQRNRFGLISDLSNPAFDEFREAVYQYHRLALDLFIQDQALARQQALDALKKIQTVSRQVANTYIFELFFSVKAQELAALFMEAPLEVRTEASVLLRQVNPGNSSIYDKLVE